MLAVADLVVNLLGRPPPLRHCLALDPDSSQPRLSISRTSQTRSDWFYSLVHVSAYERLLCSVDVVRVRLGDLVGWSRLRRVVGVRGRLGMRGDRRQVLGNTREQAWDHRGVESRCERRGWSGEDETRREEMSRRGQVNEGASLVQDGRGRVERGRARRRSKRQSDCWSR